MNGWLGQFNRRPPQSFTLTRDSVCAGDDVDAPHTRTILLRAPSEPKTLAAQLATGYLPHVAGNGHVWVCLLNGQAIAEVHVDGIRPRPGEICLGEVNQVHFSYLPSSVNDA